MNSSPLPFSFALQHNMKYVSRLLVISTILLVLSSCKQGRKVPDVSNIKVNLVVNRFEQDLFQCDTNRLSASLDQLNHKYPTFFGDFLNNILGLPMNDSSLVAIKSFISTYHPIYESSKNEFADFSKYKKDIEQGLQFTGYYFPSYKLPAAITTFIGPIDALFIGSTGSYGDAMTQSGPAIGLQLHLGVDHPAYQAGMETGATAIYQVRRYIPATIPVNAIKNVVDDMFPYNAGSRPLVEQMIEKGKRLYVLDQLMPYTDDTLKIGYTKDQLDRCQEHEADIWNFFVRNELLFSIEPAVNKEYIEDGPKTQVLGEGVPGYLGLYSGWQIVKKWMSKNGGASLEMLMKKDPRELFNEAGYKPS